MSPLKSVRLALLAGFAGLIGAPQAFAAIVPLEQYEFVGLAGTETTVSPSATIAGIAGLNILESSGLTPNSGATSINAAGWSTPGQYFSMGFNINAGFTATVSQITLTSRSSATGPGLINIEAVADGGPMILVATITQVASTVNSGYVDEILTIPTVTAAHSLVFYFMAANQTAVNGAAIGSAGTFRIGDYNPSGAPAPTPFTLSGTVVPNAGSGTVPEPASFALMTVGLAVVAVAARARARTS